MDDVSIVIPAKNEALGLALLLPQLVRLYPEAPLYVVNDGSTDDTLKICESLPVTVMNHPYSMGNGAAIKTGLRAVKTPFVVCMDADGQHQAEDVMGLVTDLRKGYDMVVGARTGASQASKLRAWGNGLYNHLASWMVGHTIPDLTSGFRAGVTAKMQQFLSLLPNGFSYPTTMTMAFFRAGYGVHYHPIVAPPRQGKSHINLWRDGTRFLLIIFKIGTLYSPLKIFTPISVCAFALGFGHYMYTYWTQGRFTNMSALLLVTAVLVFLMGLISEQITHLAYTLNAQNVPRDFKP